VRICFICTEIFYWGLYGGFGKIVRTLGRELTRHGVEVYALIPKIFDLSKSEETILDGVHVIGFVPPKPRRLLLPFTWHFSKKYIAKIDADIYHSQEVTPGTLIAMKKAPEKKHIITFQDPRSLDDVKYISVALNKNFFSTVKDLVYYRMYCDPLVRAAIKRADALFTQASFIIKKVKTLYNIKRPIHLLPNPIMVPKHVIRKSSNPTVCFLGRLDPIKRPEVFLQLARLFPEVTFIVMGRARDQRRDHYLRRKYGQLPNVKFLGLIMNDQEKYKILEKCWILINTSIYEAFPISFLEAAANKCAILSYVDSEGFVSNFGYKIKDYSLQEYARGLRYLLENDYWKKLSEKGYRYVKKVHDLNRVVKLHLKIYKSILSESLL